MKSTPDSAAPGKCLRASTRTSSPIYCASVKRSRMACRSQPSSGRVKRWTHGRPRAVKRCTPRRISEIRWRARPPSRISPRSKNASSFCARQRSVQSSVHVYASCPNARRSSQRSVGVGCSGAFSFRVPSSRLRSRKPHYGSAPSSFRPASRGRHHARAAGHNR